MSAGRATVTRCPARTSAGNLLPPNSRTVSAPVNAAPTRTSGPTTTLASSVNAPGNAASERVEQSSTTPRGRVSVTAVAGLTAGCGTFSDPPHAATPSNTIAPTKRLDMHRRLRLARRVGSAGLSYPQPAMRRSDQRRAAVFALYQHDLTGRPLDDA